MASGQKKVSSGENTPPLAISQKIEQLEQRIRELEVKVLILQHASRTGYELEEEIV